MTIHVALMNPLPRPATVFLRLTVFDPVGTAQRLFADHVMVWPNYRHGDSALERKRRAANYYFSYDVPADAPLGCYRVKVENFVEGVLRYSDTVEDDFFYVEHLAVSPADASQDNGEVLVAIKNPSSEPVPVIVSEATAEDETVFEDRELEIPARATCAVPVTRRPAFLRYAGTEVMPLWRDGPLCLRNPRFFWRDEDDETVFVLDPRAERKRNFFLTGNAREIWYRATGARSVADVRTRGNASVYDSLAEKGLILEIDR